MIAYAEEMAHMKAVTQKKPPGSGKKK